MTYLTVVSAIIKIKYFCPYNYVITYSPVLLVISLRVIFSYSSWFHPPTAIKRATAVDLHHEAGGSTGRNGGECII